MTITETAEIGADIESLWKDVGQFGALNRWHPGVTRLDVHRDASGNAKVRTRNPGTPEEQVERLQWNDSAQHCYGYSLEHTNMPVHAFAGVFRLERLADRATRVIWSVQFELSAGGDARTVDAVQQFLHTGMDSLSARYRPWFLGESRGVERDVTGGESEPVRNTPPAGAWNDTSSN